MKTTALKGFAPSVEQPVQAAPESEGAWIARLKRQRQIIKAYYEKRRAAAEAVPLPVGERQDLAKAALSSFGWPSVCYKNVREEVNEMTTTVFKGFVPSVEQPVQATLESEEAQVARLMRQREIIKAYRAGLPRPAGPEPKLVPGHAGPPGAEEAWIARLERQIIKAYYEKRRAAAEAGPLPVGERQDLAKAA